MNYLDFLKKSLTKDMFPLILGRKGGKEEGKVRRGGRRGRDIEIEIERERNID